MGIRAAELDVVYRADTRQAEAAAKRVDEGLTRTGQSATKTSGLFGRSMGAMGGFARSMSGTLASAGIGLALKGISDAASDLNETVSFTGVTFKGAAGEMENWADNALESMGMARTTALDAANTFGGLFQVTGSTAEEAAGLSKEMTQLAADMASAKNVRLEDAVLALGSGLRGEAEPMRRFNVLLSEQELLTYAVKNGMIEQGEELTEAQKVQARLGVIMEQTTDIQGDYARTADSAANEQRRATEAAKDAAATLGQSLAPIVAKVAGFAADMATKFGEAPAPIQTTALALAGIGMALPVLVRTYDAVERIGVGIGGLAGMRGRIVGIGMALQTLGASTDRLGTTGTANLTKGIAGVTAVTVAATGAIVMWTKALNQAEEASNAVADSTDKSVEQVYAWGRALEAGRITQEEFNRLVEELAPAVEADRDGIMGLNDDLGDFVMGNRTASEVNKEFARIMKASGIVLDDYASATKVTADAQDGMEGSVEKTVRALKREYTWLGMNLTETRKWVAGTVEGFNGVQGALGQFAGKFHVSGKRLTRVFDRQLNHMVEYQENWNALLARGLPATFVEHLQEMGISGAGIVERLSEMNEKEFQDIVGEWKAAQRISKETAGAVIDHTKTWGAETESSMGGAADSIQEVNEKMGRLKELAGSLGNVNIEVKGSGLDYGDPTVGGVFGGGSVAGMAQTLLGKFPGLMVTSTFRPGNPGSFHADASNPAHDLAAPGWPSDTSGVFHPQAAAVFHSAVAMFGSNLRELIYGNWIYERGRLGYYSGNDHWGHVHMARDGAVAMRQSIVQVGEPGTGGEAIVPLGSAKGRRELSRALASAGAGGSRGGSFTGTVRLINLEEAVLDLVEDGVDAYDGHKRRRGRARAKA